MGPASALGFGALLGVQLLGFYEARHAATGRAFLAYVLQVSAAGGGGFLVYRRYSQVGGEPTWARKPERPEGRKAGRRRVFSRT